MMTESPLNTANCCALMIAAPGSGHGKTLLTAALARNLTQQGKRVQAFKVGPDYLDPTILESASANPVLNLDLWVMGENHCRYLLYEAAQYSDVILVESSMGVHDNQPSNAEFAKRFDLPVVLVVNVAKFAQTISAVIGGIEQYDVGVAVHRIVGNRIASNNHHRLVSESLGSRYAGSIRRNDSYTLPTRHLGLVQAQEVACLEELLNSAARLLDEIDLNLQACEVTFDGVERQISDTPLANNVIAIAKDVAFSFIYPQNIEALKELGAEIVYFSPTADHTLPDCDAVWLPGGYPELHLPKLTKANKLKEDLRLHIESNKPLLAECGGMMILADQIEIHDGQTWSAWQLFAGSCKMSKKFQSVGLQKIDYGREGAGELRGHSFHHSQIKSEQDIWGFAYKQNGEQGEVVYRIKSATLSYMHHYFPSNLQATAKLFERRG